MADNLNKPPIALALYEEAAQEYADCVETKPHNALYDRPNTMSLVPAVEGCRVLDLGCGPGVYAVELTKRGAHVTGLDVSPAMLRQARKRLGQTCPLVQADFGRDLPFADGSFDGLLSALAVHYVENWRSMFREFHRVLLPGGWLVFSTDHPCFEFVRLGSETYFATMLTTTTWRVSGRKVAATYFRRPLEEVVNSLIEAGFQVDRMLEPKPTVEFREVAPEVYDRLMKAPDFLCVRAIKR